jgi:starch synthase
LVSSEAAPFAKSGGLGDVLGALPKALDRLGVRVSLIMPAHRSAWHQGLPLERCVGLSAPVSDRQEEGTLWKTRTGKNITVYLIQADRYFDREQLYGTTDGDYADNAERFVFFCRAALETLRLDPPQILHAHDWQAALSIVFLKAQPDRYPELAGTKAVFTVHNAAYQGLFWFLDWHLLNLDWSYFTPKYLEFYGRINLLKGGLVFSDAITTVSPSYAEELMGPEQGCGLEGVYEERAAALHGILNGADYDIWNPASDPHIAQRYQPGDLAGKEACKLELQKRFGLREDPRLPIIGVISRLTSQKGLDLLEQIADDLLRRDLQLVLLGTGERRYEEYFTQLQGRYPGRVGIRLAFDEALAHKIEAGADMFLMPSRFEPCGLAQMHSLKYGTIPIVRVTGGLKDTVEEFDPETGKGTGFLLGPYESGALLQAVDRALTLFRRRELWSVVMKNAMSTDFSWDRSAQAYLALYERLLETTRSS